jgi:hypothetical protein
VKKQKVQKKKEVRGNAIKARHEVAKQAEEENFKGKYTPVAPGTYAKKNKFPALRVQESWESDDEEWEENEFEDSEEGEWVDEENYEDFEEEEEERYIRRKDKKENIDDLGSRPEDLELELAIALSLQEQKPEPKPPPPKAPPQTKPAQSWPSLGPRAPAASPKPQQSWPSLAPG